MLQAVGFNAQFIDLILFYISSASVSVLWNGKCWESFQPNRGTQQETHCPHILLCFVWKFLANKFSDRWKVEIGPRCGYPVPDHIYLMSFLQMIYFSFRGASEQQTANMEGILESFCNWSGQKVNVGKSKLCLIKY